MPLGLYIFNYNFYNRLYTNNSVFQVLDKQDVKVMTYKVFDFFKYTGDLEGDVGYADPAVGQALFFDDKQVSHMEDVRDLLKNIFIFFSICLILFLILFLVTLLIHKKNPAKRTGLVFLWSSAVVFFLMLLLFLLATNFSSLFDRFHAAFFPQGNYMFPEGSLLITMFPFGFFFDFFITLALSSCVLAAAVLAAGIFLFLSAKRREKK